MVESKLQKRRYPFMLHENIKAMRQAKGLSQEELADSVHVVRQTISKWEQGLSVPDSDLLISLAQALETDVSTLLGETISESKEDELQVISSKLESINAQLAQRKSFRRKVIHWLFLSLNIFIILLFVFFLLQNSSYLSWDTAVAVTLLHGFEWSFVRLAPVVWIGTIVGAILTRKKK
jgi:putative transcriptional regulator